MKFPVSVKTQNLQNESTLPTKMLYTFLISPTPASCSVHLILDFTALIIFLQGVQTMKLLAMQLPEWSCHAVV
jgi:hypothetical protein